MTAQSSEGLAWYLCWRKHDPPHNEFSEDCTRCVNNRDVIQSAERAAAEAMRERCARLAEKLGDSPEWKPIYHIGGVRHECRHALADDIADALRALPIKPDDIP